MGVRAQYLAREKVVTDAEPCEICDDSCFVLRPRTFDVSIVDAQQEPCVFPACEEMIEHRRARVTDMQKAGRRRRKSDDETHCASRKALVMG
jgi:hypothetical protein